MDAMKWYHIHTFNNPYNIGKPNAELALLLEYKAQIKKYLNGFPLIFWGVGKSDTEMELVNFQIEANKGFSQIVAIDVNYVFLSDFSNALCDKIKENHKIDIYFLGINSLFEKIGSKQLTCFNRNKINVCLGNTFGNYVQTEEIIKLFKRNMIIGDYLLIGFQTDKLIEQIINRYKGNRYFEALFTEKLPQHLKQNVKNKGISWRFNSNANQIEAYIGDIQVFRSKKYKPDEMKENINNFGFSFYKEFKDNYTTCLQLYKYNSCS